jgi:hypothetical protein
MVQERKLMYILDDLIVSPPFSAEHGCAKIVVQAK